jgi:hypothetical protein
MRASTPLAEKTSDILEFTNNPFKSLTTETGDKV